MGTAPTLEPGTLFAGDYRILQPLSAGGMGAVYVAEHRFTRQRCALKLMHPGLVIHAGFRERFEREARVGALIESDHVVRTFAAGVDDASGAPWIAMELLAGSDLEHVLAKRGTLTEPEVLAVMEDVCHALGAAHKNGIVHRDLKPANLFWADVRRTRVPFTIKVLDFGIAKMIAATSVTETHPGLGTPLWMAPEQIRNDDVSAATDVWALGLIAFAMLCGRPYWRAASAPSPTIRALFDEVMNAPLPRASERAAELRATLPEGFDAWFARCIARDPRARFADAAACFAAIEPILAHGVVVRPAAGAWAEAPTAIAYGEASSSARRVSSVPSVPLTVTAPSTRTWVVAVGVGAAVVAAVAAVAGLMLVHGAISGGDVARVPGEKRMVFEVADPTHVDAIDLLPAARKAARTIDASAELTSITVRAPSADGSVALADDQANLLYEFAGKRSSFRLVAYASQFHSDPLPPSHARTIGDGPICTARSARRAARGSAHATVMSLSFVEQKQSPVWVVLTDLSTMLDARTCAPRR